MGLVTAAGMILSPGCHTAPPLAPTPVLRVASASDYVLHVELDQPLDRAAAEDVTHYAVALAASPATEVAILSATVIDTLTGRTVELVLPAGLPDGTACIARTEGLRAVSGAVLPDRSATFRTGLSYRDDMQPLLAARCDRCHDAGQSGGSYRTDSYAALSGAGMDGTPNVVPGNPNSLIVRRTAPTHSMFDRAGLTTLEAQMFSDWVVSYRARE